MAMRARRLLAVLMLLLLAGCGFHLRGQGEYRLPFKTLHIQSANDYSPFIGELKRALQAAGVQLANLPENAQLTLHIVSEASSKQILSLSGAGRVREYQLRFGISFRAFDRTQQDWLPPAEIFLLRNLSYDDSQILAKEQEDALLYQNMRSDAVQQLMRRLNNARPPAPKKHETAN